VMDGSDAISRRGKGELSGEEMVLSSTRIE